MKHALNAAILLCMCLFLLSGCSAASNPLVRAEATPIPGAEQEALHAAVSSNTSDVEAMLYFRFQDSDMLAGETRQLSVPKNVSPELAVIQALLEGPSAEKTELRRLFEAEVSVVEVSASGNTLFVTFNEAFVTNGVPNNWKTLNDWITEAPIRRTLTVQSLVNTITENFPYLHVQIMIKRSNEADTRLDRSYFLKDETGPADAFVRDENYLLTPFKTTSILLQAWLEYDYNTLFMFTASFADFETKPIYETFINDLSDAPALSNYTVSPGSVSENGQHAVQTLSLSLNRAGQDEQISSYPLQLVRENSVWKITWYHLRKLMLME